ncbi:hypothetical protein [Nonomuraea sp. NPDC049400]|uniref:hypothetical protein n=1 Tax=Nonomuraea sp. NPDC049400 TaxID=3364352 RepID=UPI00379B0A46
MGRASHGHRVRSTRNRRHTGLAARRDAGLDSIHTEIGAGLPTLNGAILFLEEQRGTGLGQVDLTVQPAVDP